VVGIDGCGKSTLSRQLARELSETSNTCLVSDTLEYYQRGRRVSRSTKWPETLRQWIGARAKRARSLAGYKIPKLIELLLRNIVARQVERNGDANVIVMDGCPLINLVAFAILYHEQRFDAQACMQAMTALTSGAGHGNHSLLERVPELALLVRLRLNRLQIPDATILLDVEPELAMQRIGSRHAQRQVHENESSLGKLRSAYLTVYRILECHPGVVARRLDAALGPDVLVEQALSFATGMRNSCRG
jgi:thymidylate kinase